MAITEKTVHTSEALETLQTYTIRSLFSVIPVPPHTSSPLFVYMG